MNNAKLYLITCDNKINGILCGHLFGGFTKGKVYLDLPDQPNPGTIGDCPKCKGHGELFVTEKYIRDKIVKLLEQREVYYKIVKNFDKEIRALNLKIKK